MPASALQQGIQFVTKHSYTLTMLYYSAMHVYIYMKYIIQIYHPKYKHNALVMNIV